MIQTNIPYTLESYYLIYFEMFFRPWYEGKDSDGLSSTFFSHFGELSIVCELDWPLVDEGETTIQCGETHAALQQCPDGYKHLLLFKGKK